MTTDATPTRTRKVEDPYVGLTYFTEEYVDLFFGRDDEAALMIGNLRASRLTLLYAESGVGKSSALRAGVVARLHAFAERDGHGGGSPRLVPVVFSSWSERPVAGLVHAVGEAVRPYLAEEDLPELPEADLEAALEAASAALDATLLVILDQFEEYFLYPDETPEQDRVAAQVARCVNRADLRANFLISIREDSYAELGDLFRGKVKNVYGNFLHLDFLGRAGAREAIEKPIERMNELQPDSEPFAVEPALVEAVLDQVRRDESDERVETTYLQLVMRRLWGEEKSAGSRVLRLATLEKLGGAQAIIGSHLDRAMGAGADGGAGLTPEQRLIAAKIFRFLVTSGGTKIALTADDLAELSGLSRAEIDPVLRHLSSPQLHILRPVVFQEEGSEPRFEIFHDALSEPIRKWRTRVEEEERNARLERERTEKEEAQRAAAEAERKAEEERRRKRIAQALLALAVAVLLVGAAIFAIRQKGLADQRESDKQSIQASERISELTWAPGFGPAAAAVASIAAYGLSPTSEARERALAQLQLNPGLPTIGAGHTGAVQSVAFLPGSNQIVSGGDHTVRRWNGQGVEIPNPLVAKSFVLEVAASRASDGSYLIAAGMRWGVDVWKFSAGHEPQKPVQELPEGPSVRGVAFDPADPELLAVGEQDGQVALWDLGNVGPHPAATMRVPGAVEDLAFAADGRSLLVASAKGGTVLPLAGKAFAPAPPIARIEGGTAAVAAAPDGSYAFAVKGGVDLWEAAGKKVHLSLPGRVESLALDRNSSVRAAAGADWNVTTWDLRTMRTFGPPRTANRAPVNDVAISPGGRIAAAGGDRLVKAWPLHPARRLAIAVGALSPAEARGNLPTIYDIAGGGEKKVAAAAGSAGTLIWPLPAWGKTTEVADPLRTIPGKSLAAVSHYFKGKKTFILVSGKKRSFVVYRMDHSCKGHRGYCPLGAPPRPFSEVPVKNMVLARTGDRLVLATSGKRSLGEGVVNLWDVSDPEKGIDHLASMPTRYPVTGLALDRAKPIVAAATSAGGMILWDVSDLRHPQPIAKKNPEGQALLALAFAANSNLLASGGRGQQVVLWKVRLRPRDGQEALERLPGSLLQRQSIDSLTFGPGGGTLAAADAEGNVCLYRVDSRQLIGDRSCLRGYNIGHLSKGGFEAVKFGKMDDSTEVLFTAGRGEPLVAWNSLLWNLSDSGAVDAAVRKRVCALADLNLERDEWNSVFGSTDLAGSPEKTCSEKGSP